MNNIVYLKEPGILYDMLFALKLRFNGERAYVPLRTGTLSFEEDEKLYQKIIHKLSDIPDYLFPLFYYDSENEVKTAIFTYIYEHIDLTTDGLIAHFYDSLRDIERLKKTVYKNYISPLCPEVFDRAALFAIKNEILSSPLPDNFKIYLYDFFVFGEDQIEDIISAFKKVEQICRDYHDNYKREIQDYSNNFGEAQIKLLSTWYSQNISQCKLIYVTYCMLLKNAKIYYRYNLVWLSIIGLNSCQTLFQLNENSEVNLYELGNILNDKNRLKILDLLSRNNMYCAEIARELNLKNNSTLYHLIMMEKAGILCAENQPKCGRRIYYKINRNYINALMKIIKTKFTGVQNNENN